MNTIEPTVFVNQQMSEGNEEKELNTMYQELGKAYYEGGFEDPLPQLLPLFDKITDYKRNIEMKKLKIQQREMEEKNNTLDKEVKYRFCTNCGNKMRANAKFCGKCGTAIE